MTPIVEHINTVSSFRVRKVPSGELYLTVVYCRARDRKPERFIVKDGVTSLDVIPLNGRQASVETATEVLTAYLKRTYPDNNLTKERQSDE